MHRIPLFAISFDMKLFLPLIFFFCFTCYISAQPTYFKRISQNGNSSAQYTHPEDSVLSLEEASLSDSGNTFLIIGTSRGSSQLIKIDSLGYSSYVSIQAGYHGGLSMEKGVALHATQDGGCIFSRNHDSWVSGPSSRTYVSKIDHVCTVQWDILLPIQYIGGFEYQKLYDIGLLPNFHYACLCENNIYILDSLGNVIDSLNFQGPGKLTGFSNGDLFVNTTAFKGRVDINGTTIWQTTDTIFIQDTNLVVLRNDTLHFLNSLTGSIQREVPFTQNGDSKMLLMKDGGWCTYNSSRIHRYDPAGQLKWLENVHLTYFGMELICEQANGSILTGGTYLYENCTYNEYDYSSFIGTIDTSGKSVMDSTFQVWPGDANDDGVCEFGDLVYIALAQGSTGPSRFDTNSIFSQYYNCDGDINTNFPGNFAIGINHQQCDAASNGIIDSVDIAEFGSFSSSRDPNTTPWRIRNPDGHKTNLSPPYFSLLPERDTVNSGDSIRVYIVIGSNGTIVDSIFGIAFSLLNDTTFSGDVINYNAELMDSRLGLQSDLRYYHRYLFNPNVAFMSARRDLQNAYLVHDTIGYMELYIDTSLSQSMDVNFVITSFKAITAGGFPVDFQYDIRPIHANRISTGIKEKEAELIQLSPNPANENITLHNLPPVDLQIRIYDEQGKECYLGRSEKNQSLSINIEKLHKGIYLLICTDAENSIISKKFSKQ